MKPRIVWLVLLGYEVAILLIGHEVSTHELLPPAVISFGFWLFVGPPIAVGAYLGRGAPSLRPRMNVELRHAGWVIAFFFGSPGLALLFVDLRSAQVFLAIAACGIGLSHMHPRGHDPIGTQREKRRLQHHQQRRNR